MKFGEIQSAMRTVAAGALLLSAVAALTLGPLLPVVAAESDKDPVTTSAIGPAVKMRFLALGVGKSMVVDLPRDVKDVLVADPKIANAVVRSSQRAYIIGAAVGQTNVVFFDADGQQVASYDIAVKRDLNGVRAALRQSLPGIQIEGVGESVLLTGSVSSPVEAQQAGEIAARLVGGAEQVVNSIVVRGRDQVMLKVTVAEVRRDIVKQMGVDLSASMNYGTAVVNFNNSNPFTAFGRPLVADNGLERLDRLKGCRRSPATMRAMETAGVVRTLAEPNLTAISGEVRDLHRRRRISDPRRLLLRSRSRIVCTTQIQYKKFGISLNFTPVVLSEGRISLRVMTEVSEVSNDNAITAEPERQLAHHSLDQDPPRRDDAGNTLGRLDGDGRPDPGADQAGRQRLARPRPVAGSRRAVPQPGLRQQPDRTDGSGDALCGPRGGAEGTVPPR